MCIQVTKTANRFEISSLLEKIVFKQFRWCLTFVGLYIITILIILRKETQLILIKLNQSLSVGWLVSFIVLNVTFNNISVIAWR